MTHMKKKLQVILLIVLSAILLCLLSIIFLNKRIVRVTFDTDGGTPIEAIVLKKGSVLKLQKETTREGFVFDAWYLDGEPYDFSQKVERSFTLYATWKKPSEKASSEGPDGSTDETEKPISSDVNSVEIITPTPSSSSSSSSSSGSTEPSDNSDPSSSESNLGNLTEWIDWGNLGHWGGFVNLKNCGPLGSYNSSTGMCERILEEDAILYGCNYPGELKNGKCYTESTGNIKCVKGTYTDKHGGGCFESPGITADYPPICPPYPLGYTRVVYASDPTKCYRLIDINNEQQCKSSGYEYRRIFGPNGVAGPRRCVNMKVSIPAMPCRAPVAGEILVSAWDICYYARFYSPPPDIYCVNGTVQFGKSCYEHLNELQFGKYKCAKPGYTLSSTKCKKLVTYKPY